MASECWFLSVTFLLQLSAGRVDVLRVPTDGTSDKLPLRMAYVCLKCVSYKCSVRALRLWEIDCHFLQMQWACFNSASFSSVTKINPIKSDWVLLSRWFSHLFSACVSAGVSRMLCTSAHLAFHPYPNLLICLPSPLPCVLLEERP